MKPVRDAEGYIVNADVLRVEQVVHEKVRCPACGQALKMWPEGWDSHAAHTCEGLENEDQEKRKVEFRAKFRHLYR